MHFPVVKSWWTVSMYNLLKFGIKIEPEICLWCTINATPTEKIRQNNNIATMSKQRYEILAHSELLHEILHALLTTHHIHHLAHIRHTSSLAT